MTFKDLCRRELSHQYTVKGRVIKTRPIFDDGNEQRRKEWKFMDEHNPISYYSENPEIFEIDDMLYMIFHDEDNRLVFCETASVSDDKAVQRLSRMYYYDLTDGKTFRLFEVLSSEESDELEKKYQFIKQVHPEYLIADNRGIYYQNMSEQVKNVFAERDWYFAIDTADNQKIPSPYYGGYIIIKAFNKFLAKDIFNWKYGWFNWGYMNLMETQFAYAETKEEFEASKLSHLPYLGVTLDFNSTIEEMRKDPETAPFM